MLIGKIKRKMGKNALCLIFVFLLSINSFAAIVSDNDGAAFVTKAEFEALKQNFADQITNYNDSIDEKIDGAIASYLAGIQLSQKVTQESLLNQFSMSYKKNWTFTQTRLGTYNNAYLHFGHGVAQWGTNTNYLCETKISNKDGSGGDWVKQNEDNPDVFYIGKAVKFGGDDFFTINRVVESFPTAGAKAAGWGWSGWTSSTVQYNVEEKTYIPTSEKFGNETITCQINHAGHIATVTGVGTWSSPDEDIDKTFLTLLPGDVVDVTANQYLVEEEKIDVIDKSRVVSTRACTTGYANAVQGSTSYYMKNVDITGWGDKTKLNVYGHKYSETNWNKIINNDVSVLMNYSVLYYNGLPLFTASDNGVVTLKLIATNSAIQKTIISISENKFQNTSIGTGGISVVDADCSFTDWSLLSGDEYTIKFNVKKDKTYWIKGCPETNDSTSRLVTTNIFIETE